MTSKDLKELNQIALDYHILELDKAYIDDMLKLFWSNEGHALNLDSICKETGLDYILALTILFDMIIKGYVERRFDEHNAFYMLTKKWR